MKNILILNFVLFIALAPQNIFAQSSNNTYVIELDAKYDEYFSMQFANPEYNYLMMAFPGEVSLNDEKKQLSFTPTNAGSYEITTSYYVEEWDDVILGSEQFKIPTEYIGKTVVLQLE